MAKRWQPKHIGCTFSFFVNICSEALIEYVSQTDLKLPTFAVIQVSGEASGRIITVTIFVHRENRSVALILTLIGRIRPPLAPDMFFVTPHLLFSKLPIFRISRLSCSVFLVLPIFTKKSRLQRKSKRCTQGARAE